MLDTLAAPSETDAFHGVYPAGADDSNAAYSDVATDRYVHGFQVFAQYRPNGEPTGRHTFLDQNGMLCGLALAERKRREAVLTAAPDLLSSLKTLVCLVSDAGLSNMSRHVGPDAGSWLLRSHDALEKAIDAIRKSDGHQPPSPASLPPLHG